MVCAECGTWFEPEPHRGTPTVCCSHPCRLARRRHTRRPPELARRDRAAHQPLVAALRALQGDHYGRLDPSPALVAHCDAVLRHMGAR